MKGMVTTMKKLFSVLLAISLLGGLLGRALASSPSAAAGINYDPSEYDDPNGSIAVNEYQVEFACDEITGTVSETGFIMDGASNSAESEIRSFSQIPNIDEGISANCDYCDYTVSAAIVTALDDTTYQIATSDGEVFAIYSTAPSKVSRAAWPINWTASSNEIKTDNNTFSTYDGFAINFDVRFSRQGTSYIGVALHDSKVFEVVFIKDAGMAGNITFTKNMGSASFAIQNKTVYSITYTGAYAV